jgi:hypothetical protein
MKLSPCYLEHLTLLGSETFELAEEPWVVYKVAVEWIKLNGKKLCNR